MSDNNSIFSYNSYQSYLCDRLGKLGSRNGLRLQFAQKLGIHPSYVTLVLKRTSHLSLEQAMDANLFLEHTKNESDFFILLVSRDRSGSNNLRKHYQSQIDAILKIRSQIENHISDKFVISKEVKEEYYSSYVYAAIFVLSSIPDFNSFTAIAKALNVSVSKVEKIILFLVRSGILEPKSNWFQPGKRMIHLNNEDVTVKKHHSNWRLHALQSIDNNPSLGTHYSACLSLSKSDAEKINSLILENLEKYLKIVNHSKEEIAYVYNFDFYPLIE